MIPQPPRQEVSITRMTIYSVLPILSIYAGWRMEKFRVLFLINLAMGFASGIILGETLDSYGSIIGWIAGITITIVLVRYFAKAYNKQIHNDQQDTV